MDLSKLNRLRKDASPVQDNAVVEQYEASHEPDTQGAYELDGQPGIWYRDADNGTEIMDDDGTWMPVNDYANSLPPGHSQLSVEIQRGDIIRVHHSGAGGAAVAAALPYMLASPNSQPTSFQLPVYTLPVYATPNYTQPDYQEPNYDYDSVPAPTQPTRPQRPTDRRPSNQSRTAQQDQYDAPSYPSPVAQLTRQERSDRRKHLRGNAIALAIIAASPFVYHVVGGVELVGGKDSIVDIHDPVHMFHKPMHDGKWVVDKVTLGYV